MGDKYVHRRYIVAIVGLVATAALLWWTLHDVVWSDVVTQIRSVRVVPLTGALVLALLNVVGRGIRWGILFPVGTPRRSALIQATFVGALANNVLPIRAGEVASAVALNRADHAPIGLSLGAVGIGRVLDILTIIGMLGVALALAPASASVPPAVGPAAITLVVAATTVLVISAIWTRGFHRFVQATATRVLPNRYADRVADGVGGLIDGLAVLRRPTALGRAVVLSLAIWTSNAVSIHLGMTAFGVDVPLSAAFTVQGLIALGIAIPSSPGFFGPFEAAAKIALSIYGIGASAAAGFILPFHVVVYFLPTTLIGLASLSAIGTGFGRLRADLSEVGEIEPR